MKKHHNFEVGKPNTSPSKTSSARVLYTTAVIVWFTQSQGSPLQELFRTSSSANRGKKGLLASFEYVSFYHNLKIMDDRGEREFPFPSIPKNESLWFPFPNYGNGFFHSLPVPEFRECFFSFPSRSRIMGMVFFHSLPVPELWEWIFFIPFPFPNCGNGFF